MIRGGLCRWRLSVCPANGDIASGCSPKLSKNLLRRVDLSNGFLGGLRSKAVVSVEFLKSAIMLLRKVFPRLNFIFVRCQ